MQDKLKYTDGSDIPSNIQSEEASAATETVPSFGHSDSLCGQVSENQVKKLSPVLKIIALTALGLSAFAVILRVLLSSSPEAAEFFYRYIVKYLQAFMAALTSFIPFSLAETLLLMLPAAIIAEAVICGYRLYRGDTYRLKRTLVIILTTACFIFCNFIFNLSVLYCRPSLSSLSGIDGGKASEDELCAATFLTVYMMNDLVQNREIIFDRQGASVSPYGFSELDRKIDQAFDKYAEKNDWVSPFGARAKIISMSDFMTYTHISGIYTQYTGEANININYPDYVVCSTIAHEKAHQRGIAPEDEANLVAFFVLSQSGDPYLEYCGYMSVFSSLAAECRMAAPEFYDYNISPLIPSEIFGEFAAYSEFFEKYSNSQASKVADTLNNGYLKLNGESEGIRSYNLTADMTAKYLLSPEFMECLSE